MRAECHFMVNSLSAFVNEQWQTHRDVWHGQRAAVRVFWVSVLVLSLDHTHKIGGCLLLLGMRGQCKSSMSRISSAPHTHYEATKGFGGDGQVANSGRFHSRIVSLADSLSVAGERSETRYSTIVVLVVFG
jgi:hypothetical protein